MQEVSGSSPLSSTLIAAQIRRRSGPEPGRLGPPFSLSSRSRICPSAAGLYRHSIRQTSSAQSGRPLRRAYSAASADIVDCSGNPVANSSSCTDCADRMLTPLLAIGNSVAVDSGGLTSVLIDLDFSLEGRSPPASVSPSESFSSSRSIFARPASGRTETRSDEGQFPLTNDEGPAASSSSKRQTSRKAGTQSPGPDGALTFCVALGR